VALASQRGTWAQRQLVKLARKNLLVGQLAKGLGEERAQTLLSLLSSGLPATGSVLDVGTGTSHLASAIRARGLRVVACDSADLALVSGPFVIADGARLPFANCRFDAVLLVTVLHHVPATQHLAMLAEGIRVLRDGGRLIMLEDSYEGRVERLATSILDSLLNFEFVGHPHANRTTRKWEEVVSTLGQTILGSSEHFVRYGPIRIRHLVLVTERKLAARPS
jgi:SAM-dependent methyltransferase